MKCKWAYNSDLEMKYHDEEWGKVTHDERKLFEFLVLEIMQSGLSWYTVLLKRENFQKAFDNFDFNIICDYDDNKINQLMNNKGIIRNLKKIKAVINNAKKFKEIQEKFESFDKYIWSYTNNKQIVKNNKDISDLVSYDSLSIKISNDLKKYGFEFIGKTIIYSYMQAIGIIDDHINDCICKRS